MATVRLPEHSHCKYCGDPVPFGEEYCGEECREADRERDRKEKNKDIAFYAVSIATIAVIIAAGFLLRGRIRLRRRRGPSPCLRPRRPPRMRTL